MDQEHYDLIAKVAPGVSKHESHLMMQQLLLERFHLKAHRENRERRVYTLRISKRGLKIRPVLENEEAEALHEMGL